MFDLKPLQVSKVRSAAYNDGCRVHEVYGHCRDRLLFAHPNYSVVVEFLVARDLLTTGSQLFFFS